jgi:2-oxoisovalerate dehydrogenase E1 component beta subunit
VTPVAAGARPSTTYVEAIREGILEEMERDERVFLLGEDIGVYGGAFKVTEGLLDRFGEERVLDTPLSETAIVGAAVGAAMMGMRPVAEMQFADFFSCAFDMITNFAAKSRYRTGVAVPLVVRGPSGGGVHGGPFHSQNPEAYFAHTPGLKIVQPATAGDAKGLIKAAIRDDDPVLFFEHKFLYRRVRDVLPEGDHVVPIGTAAVRRRGRDLSILTYGAMVWTALDAAATLESEGIDAEIVDLRTSLSARRGDDSRVGRPHEPGHRRPRGDPHRRHRRRGGGGPGGALFREPRRPGRPRDGARHARSLLAPARRALPAERREDLPRGSGAHRLLERRLRGRRAYRRFR